MTFYIPPTPATQADLAALAASVVPSMGPFMVATLPVPSAALLGRTAIVTDLYGTRTGRVVCELDFTDYYFWRPTGADSYRDIPASASNLTITALGSPSYINLTGNIAAGVTRAVTLDTTAGWPGCVKRPRHSGTLGIASVLNIAGTGLGSGVAVLLGNKPEFTWDYNGGAPRWVQTL